MAKKKDMRKYKNEFIDLYNYGFSLREIASMYDVSKGTISRYVREEVDIQRGLTDKQKKQAKQLYGSGLSVNAVATQLNASYSTVCYYLTKEYGKLTDLDRKYAHLVDDFKKMYAQGYSANEIGAKYGIHRQTVLTYLREEKAYVRDYSETSRLYDLYDNYFDVLDSEKAYILGIVFAIGRLTKAVATQFIELKAYKDNIHLLEEIISVIYESEAPALNLVDNTYVLRVTSKRLYDRVNELGVSHKDSGVITEFSSEIKSYERDFWDGFFYANATVNSRFVTLSAYREHLPLLCKYLDSKGILYKKYHKNASHVQVERNIEVSKLVKIHPIVGYKIKCRAKELESQGKKHSWKKVLDYNGYKKKQSML